MMNKGNIPDAPVLLMLFNRPETTREVFKKVREARPSRLFVAANGPRPDKPKDQELCAAVRDILKEVDWPCEIHTNFRDTNIGMQPHWRLALDWFFSCVDSGIILEDDCVPHPSFFSYCDDLLKKYSDDKRVMHINGSNFQFGRKRGDASYYFSKYPHVWGWATWKRAWRAYDNSMFSFPAFEKDKLIDTAVTSTREKKYWSKFFGGLYSGTYDTCDVKWLYAIWTHKGICITPNINMITNIGHGFGAGHTVIKEKTMDQTALDIGAVNYPVSYDLAFDADADRYTFKVCYRRSFLQKAIYKLVLALSKIWRY